MPRILGDFLFVAYDYDAAITRFEMTLALNPEGESDPAHHSYSEILSFRGRHDEAIRSLPLLCLWASSSPTKPRTCSPGIIPTSFTRVEARQRTTVSKTCPERRRNPAETG